jgi:hypothetical protein
MEAGYDENIATTNIVHTRSGYPIDLNNCPGKLRRNLVIRGELDSGFALPDNMPGKVMRERGLLEEKKKLDEADKEIKVGEFIQVGKRAYPVVKVDEEKVYYEKMKAGEIKLFSVPRDKANLVTPSAENQGAEDSEE